MPEGSATNAASYTNRRDTIWVLAWFTRSRLAVPELFEHRGINGSDFVVLFKVWRVIVRKIKLIENISLDGVIQAPGGPDEDGEYEHGGWTTPFFEPATGEAIEATQGRNFDLLLGRRTYDIFAGYWPNIRESPMADNLNAATKYVATHRPESLGWGPAKGRCAELVDSVRILKSEDGPDLIVWGSSTLTPLLLESGLADEVLLLVCPVLLGTGKRFFSGSAQRELALVSMDAVASGVLMSTYKPIGPLRTGSFADAPV